MEKKKSVKDTLAELAMMRKASKKRQEGKNVTSEDIKARMQKRETAKAKRRLNSSRKKLVRLVVSSLPKRISLNM
jgi:hypothetical protein